MERLRKKKMQQLALSLQSITVKIHQDWNENRHDEMMITDSDSRLFKCKNRQTTNCKLDPYKDVTMLHDHYATHGLM